MIIIELDDFVMCINKDVSPNRIFTLLAIIFRDLGELQFSK